jgi:hypothetical protein
MGIGKMSIEKSTGKQKCFIVYILTKTTEKLLTGILRILREKYILQTSSLKNCAAIKIGHFTNKISLKR